MGMLSLATDYDAVRSIVATVMDATRAGRLPGAVGHDQHQRSRHPRR
ncbi:MAG: hypothetical protein J2P32_04110 [Actinobacteria bacterium]|nr:hypothetical protein [Actinomycetota bacterium]